MLPLTTSVAPSTRRAAEGSSILRARTTLEGTTQSDWLPTSRFESVLVRLSIKPSATGALLGLLPMLSKGRTAMCFSVEPEKAWVMRERNDGGANTTAAAMATARAASHHRDRCGRCAAAAHDGVDAWLMYFSMSSRRRVAVGAEGSKGSKPAAEVLDDRKVSRSSAISPQSEYRSEGLLARAR